ncbi:FAD-binding domain-containing protein [Aspergillus brunneoviolaceus CBS 621.78]|uniref:FAD-binding domain-containing protein n=1 Tax=Aspergillus brunneoviolaceus CBS 621.78 TaxID=1450534 RepID=A0ACD1FZB0_9EURO|nr:FAD-binding domain-containing protein [Aspergillus brunneoviolaceus CBS 621.78]RAH42320.1 FAD-binding domain-containing protein [Aspergillus brunneoviolaceus CBS 621.78]
MVHFLCATACALSVLSQLGTACTVRTSSAPSTLVNRDWTAAEIAPRLGPLLSEGSSIFGPTDSRWASATERYDTYTEPHVEVVVQPGQESDIPIIIEFANNNSISFLAVNRGHGMTTTQWTFHGIKIDLSLLRNLTVSPGGQTAWIQGGGWASEVIGDLWDQGYVMTTGSAECPGILGVGLGGGHGRLEGMYGLMSDNFVTLNVVLANGTMLNVSNTSHPDLFWAMKGAGHNFGVVTSFEIKIYPRPMENWYYKINTWTEDHLETVFTELAAFHANGNYTSDMAVNYGMYMLDTSLNVTDRGQADPEAKPIIWWSFVYAGSQADAQQYLDPFDAIPALTVSDGSVPYNQIADKTGTGLTSGLCADGYAHVHYTSGLQTWNQYPVFAGSAVVMEDYAHQGVAAVDSDSSAFPWRDRSLLNFISMTYASNETIDQPALDWAAQTKALWEEGDPSLRPSTYVNYAHGDESLESMYGYESWRLTRLRALKAQFDPESRFNYYNPITTTKSG